MNRVQRAGRAHRRSCTEPAGCLSRCSSARCFSRRLWLCCWSLAPEGVWAATATATRPAPFVSAAKTCCTSSSSQWRGIKITQNVPTALRMTSLLQPCVFIFLNVQEEQRQRVHSRPPARLSWQEVWEGVGRRFLHRWEFAGKKTFIFLSLICVLDPHRLLPLSWLVSVSTVASGWIWTIRMHL